MNKPKAEVEKQFNANGIYFSDNESFGDARPFAKIGVLVEALVLGDAKLIEIDFMTTVKGAQGSVISFTDWKVTERDGQKLLQFMAWTPVPAGTFDQLPSEGDRYTSFWDLCRMQGQEVIDKAAVPHVELKPDPRYVNADLGWHLPCRVVDPLINGLGKLNDFMLSGILEDALLYGPLTIHSS